MDDPDEFGVAAVGDADFRHAEGGGADEVGPPAVVLVIRDAEVFPSAEGWAAGEDDVFGVRNGSEQEKQEGDQAVATGHGCEDNERGGGWEAGSAGGD